MVWKSHRLCDKSKTGVVKIRIINFFLWLRLKCESNFHPILLLLLQNLLFFTFSLIEINLNCILTTPDRNHNIPVCNWWVLHQAIHAVFAYTAIGDDVHHLGKGTHTSLRGWCTSLPIAVWVRFASPHQPLRNNCGRIPWKWFLNSHLHCPLQSSTSHFQ